MVKDYLKGKIYRIVSDQTNQVYIGSTIQTLEQRFVRHRTHFKCGKYYSSAELLKYDDARIELVRDFPCNSERELSKAEDDEMIACGNKVVNRQRANRTKAEYYQANKAEIIEKVKAYREANLAERREKDKAYYQDNKAEIAEKKKEHYEANKAEKLEKQKANYEANKAEINEQRKVKYDCPCGSSVSKGGKSQHEKTAKHQNYIVDLEKD